MLIRKRLLALVTTAVLLCTMNIAAFAHDVPDTSRNGSIQITMRQGETAVSGGTLTIYRVGAVRAEDGNYRFELTGDFADCGESLKDIQSAALAKRLAQYASNKKLTGTTKDIGKDGKVSFTNLELGLYLLVQGTAADGYYKADPFLVTVPMLENGVYCYDVDASPKVEVEKKPTTPTTPNKPTTRKPTTSTLPKTGQLWWPVSLLAVGGILLYTIGWNYNRKN